MCGICGFLSTDGNLAAESYPAMALAMAQTLVHRGPDDFGAWADPQSGIALGHRRLSILDLSAAGHQPMESGDFVIVYNGEIYNFLDLRRELEDFGHVFRSHSDTEVLLEAIKRWGIKDALTRIQGMFAFGIWDRKKRSLSLARDRAGKKPLYYGWCGKTFLFGSELKALCAHPNFDPEIDRNALGLLIQYGWIPTPYSIFKQIRKLPAGAMLTVVQTDMLNSISPQVYWSASEVVKRSQQSLFQGSLEDAADELEKLLQDSVRRRMIADVSLGALLSGGIDSTTVVSLMQSITPRPVKTFTIGFLEPKYNEAMYAKAIADYLHTDHTELTITAADSIDVIPRLPTIYDEPFADVSQIPTFLVSSLARSQVTVALSGDGGDEVFAGYNRYLQTMKMWDAWKHKPLLLRRAWANAMSILYRSSWAILGTHDLLEAKGISEWQRFPAKLEKRSRLLPAENLVDLSIRMHTVCERGNEFVISAKPVPTALRGTADWNGEKRPLNMMICMDFINSMSDDILVKVDRASMAASLEVRCPLLDHRIVEFAWSLPSSMLLSGREGKLVLKKVLNRYVPRELTERPKQVFGVPIGEWLRGPLREWAEDLLSKDRIHRENFLVYETVQRVWKQHVSGWKKHSSLLWNILMFQAWYQAQNSGNPSACYS